MYNLIGYLPEAEDYCRGCLMASRSAEVETHFNLDREQAVKLCAKLLADKREFGPGWDLTLCAPFEDSLIVYGTCNSEGQSPWEKYVYGSEKYVEADLILDDLSKIIIEAAEFAESLVAEEKLKKHQRAIEIAEENKRRYEEDERKLFAQLSVKYKNL